MSLELIAATVFLTLFLLLAVVLIALARHRDPLGKRLDAVRQDHREGGPSGQSAPPIDGLIAIDPASFHSFRADLTHAGFRGRHAVAWFWMLRVLLTLSLVTVGFWLQRNIQSDALKVLIPLGFGIFGFAAPRMFVQSRVQRRRENIRRAIPSVLDLIIVCVEAGLSLNAAIQRISREMRHTYSELSTELMVLNQEIFLGFSRSDAFRNLALRTGVDELRSLATVLMQSDRLGTSIADVLRVQADILRTKRRQDAMEHAQKMPIKLLFPLILFIFPELLVVLLGPAALSLYQSITGVR